MFHKLSLYFLPHEKNNHRALILQPSFLGIFIALYLLNQSLLKTITFVKPGILGYASEISSQKVVDLTNRERQKLNLPPLTYNSVLSQSAASKARDMFDHNYWAHTSPSGTTPWDFFRAQGYQYSVAGENLARDFYDTDAVIKAWMNSPTHRANIVNTKYREIGIGVVNGTLNGVKTTLVVQHFGTPLRPVADKQANLAPPATAQDLPEAVVEPIPHQTEILQDSLPPSPQMAVEPPFTINPVTMTKAFGSILFIVILAVLVIDAFLTYKHRTHRLAGSSAGHISFLAIIFMLLLFTRQGSIF